MKNKNKIPNVYYATHWLTEITFCLVAIFKDGEYHTKEGDKGSFGDLAEQITIPTARKRARKQYGYSKSAFAEDNFGKDRLIKKIPKMIYRYEYENDIDIVDRSNGSVPDAPLQL